MTKIPKLLIQFHNTFKWFNHNPKIVFSIILVLSISSLVPNTFLINHLLATSQKHIGHHDVITTVKKPTKIQNSNDNAIIKIKPVHNNRETDGLLNTVIGDNTKVVILTFGDTIKSQFSTAKPILDHYGFKASFFITCNYVGDQKQMQRLSWNDILALQEDGQDVESKGMTHADLNDLSPNALDFEISASKQCLENHGIKSPNIFAVVHGDAWNSTLVIDTISK